MLLLPPEASDSIRAPGPSELLIKEARRRARRRRLAAGSIALVVVVAGVLAVAGGAGLFSSTRNTNRGQRTRPTVLATGPTVALDLAGSLAVGRSGDLYVAAPNEHRILVMLREGKFKVVAGTGVAGYSGNGGKAINAQLSDPTDLTFDATGDLYFVDSGRVRVVMSDGVIETVAGDGLALEPSGSRPIATVVDGTPALRASFGSVPSIAFGPSGDLYIATNTQLLRETRTGNLVALRTHRVSFGNVPGLPTSLDEGLDTLAVAKDGSLYVSGFNGWAVWHVATNGAATYVGYDRGSGGTSPASRAPLTAPSTPRMAAPLSVSLRRGSSSSTEW